jgi:predicted SAM-dependent methyltransferase
MTSRAMETRKVDVTKNADGTFDMRCPSCGQIVEEKVPSVRAVLYRGTAHECAPKHAAPPASRGRSLYQALYNSRLVAVARKNRFFTVPLAECQRYAALLMRPYIVARYLRSHDVRKLQIGTHVASRAGWLNSDLYPKTLNSLTQDIAKRFQITMDAAKPFPLPDQSFDYIFSEHQMEHISHQGAISMLSECYRILRPGGKVRIAVPSLDRLIELLGARTPLHDRYIMHKTGLCYPGAKPHPCFAFNAAFMNWGHRFIYDRETLGAMLGNAGFRNVRFFDPGDSDDPNLRSAEVRTAELDAYETMVAQAAK